MDCAESDSLSDIPDISTGKPTEKNSLVTATLQSQPEMQYQAAAPSKIDVLLKAAGNAPILSNKKWCVERGKKLLDINAFVRKCLKCESHVSVFLYVNQSFAPSPDVDVGTLYECFGVSGKLTLHYCTTQAWG